MSAGTWPLLEALPPEQAEPIRRRARRRSFAAGEAIFHEGDPSDSLHVILEGKVAFLVTSAEGNQLMFRVSGPPEFFGELSLLIPGALRSATARALETCETLSIHRTDFERMRQEQPAVTEILLRLLAERVSSLSARLEEALFVPAEQRVLRRVLELSKVYGPGGSPTLVPLSQEQLASLAGTARATVNRVLRQEQTMGNVRLGRQRVTVLQPKALARHAGLD